MAVKITRREEHRDTSLQNFIFSAIVPLLVAGLLGFFIGQAAHVDRRVNSLDVTAMEQRALAAERQLGERGWFIGEVDSLTEVLLKSREERRQEFSDIVREGPPPLGFEGDNLANWSRDMREDYDRYSRAISELEGSVAGRGVLSQESVYPVIRLFKDLNQENRSHFSDRRACYGSQTIDQNNLTESFAEESNDRQKEIEEMESQLNIAKRKLENRDVTIEGLRNQINPGAPGSGPAPKVISYRTEASTIQTAAAEIEAVSQRIPSGVLVSKKKKQEIEDQIMRQVRLINGAVEVIE